MKKYYPSDLSDKAFKARIGEVGPVTAGCAMIILSSVAVISLPPLAKAFSKLPFTSMLFTTLIIAKSFSDSKNESDAKVQKKWNAPFSMMNVKKGNPPPETYNQLFTRSIQLPSNKLQGAANPQPSTTKLTGSFFSSASTRLLRPWVR